VFEVAADAYDRFMGRYSVQLAPQLADFAHVRPGQRVLDVGCGPGALTAELVARVGPDHVAAADPSTAFVAAVRDRHPGVEVAQAPAEELPFADASFDAALAQLVVHFMAQPVVGLTEMARVTRPRGAVAACVWDFGTKRGPLTTFWQAARELDETAQDESDLPGTRAGHLRELLGQAGLREIEDTILQVHVTYASFDEWWEPFTRGIGPAGTYAAGLDDERRTALRERCRQLLPDPPFTISAVAWAACGVV
jgi:ubiquinone/menaquinone biosynthesis C-methylase UbiE